MAELLVEHKNLKLHGEQVLSILLVKSIVAINERDLYPSQSLCLTNHSNSKSNVAGQINNCEHVKLMQPNKTPAIEWMIALNIHFQQKHMDAPGFK